MVTTCDHVEFLDSAAGWLAGWLKDILGLAVDWAGLGWTGLDCWAARAGLAWVQPNFEVLRKVSACDDDRHFSKTLQFPHALKVTHRRSGLPKLTQHSQGGHQGEMVTLRG